MKQKAKKKKIVYGPLVIGALGAIGIIIVTLFVTYTGRNGNAVTDNVSRIVPFPAALIGWTHSVSINDLRKNVDATRRFYEGQDFASVGVRIDFTTEEGQKKLQLWEQILLDKLIEDEIVYVLAKRANIVITDGQVHARVRQELDRHGKGRVVQKNIYQLWGFTLKDFEERIVKPQLYREALEKYAQKKYDTRQMRQRALEAHTKLSEGADFSEVVKQYSEGVDEDDQTGDAGWFSYSDLLPEIADAVFELNIGKYSDVIETNNGFHIVKVEDKRSSPAGEQVLLRHIIIFKPLFAQWLDNQMKSFSVRVLLPAYAWNEKTRHVDIEDPELKAYAEELRENMQDEYKSIIETAQVGRE